MNQEDVIREVQERYERSGRTFNELQRRLWAAAEASKLGRGGITIVSKALRISPNTIKRGIQEIAAGQADASASANARIRKPGGGRKSKHATPDHFTQTGSHDASKVASDGSAESTEAGHNDHSATLTDAE